MMAVLYDDTVQVLTHRDSGVRKFSDLKGRTIGLPRNGGQYQTFLRVADHFAGFTIPTFASLARATQGR
jgi:TRAP-type uncharacterized transport system substrate-binding protein